MIHRVDRMQEIERQLLEDVPENPDEMLARTVLVGELAALSLADVANTLRVHIYGAVTPTLVEDDDKD